MFDPEERAAVAAIMNGIQRINETLENIKVLLTPKVEETPPPKKRVYRKK